MMWTMRLVALVLLALVSLRVEAQAPTPSGEGSNQQTLKPGQLDALVAPIALYPDTLVAQVLMASTYPLEVVQAERWVMQHKNLQGDPLKKEVEKQGWDDSVKALAATPSVLTMMSSKLDWTQKLGDAVLAQQPDVMDAIQRLRTKAYANNKLQDTKEQKVTVRQENNKQLVAIEPTDPGTIYVPYYDPAVVYGEWPYPDYPPYYWEPEPGYIASGIIATGIAFGGAYALGRWVSGGRFWGGSVNWGDRNININRGAHVSHWQHNPGHRRGVGYNNAAVQQKFGGKAVRAGNKGQLDLRGRSGQQVLKPGGDRAKLGENRQANRAKAGDRGPGKQLGQAKLPSSQARRSPQHSAARNVQPGRVANRQAVRPRGSVGINRGSFGYAAGRSGGHVGGLRSGARAGGLRGGGGRAGGGRGGRRSDVRLKHDIGLLGRLDNGLGFYRFAYNGSGRVYVGVMAQEVQAIAPEAVVRGRDGYLRVRYDKLGLKFQTYDQWTASGAVMPRPRHLMSPGPGNTVRAEQSRSLDPRRAFRGRP